MEFLDGETLAEPLRRLLRWLEGVEVSVASAALQQPKRLPFQVPSLVDYFRLLKDILDNSRALRGT
jgi:hypothetical protein